MSDLQCPVRVHLGADGPSDDRVALVLDRSGRAADEIAAELEEIADQYRGEAVRLVVDADLAADVVRRLTGRPGTGGVLEGDAHGWRLVPGPREEG